MSRQMLEALFQGLSPSDRTAISELLGQLIESDADDCWFVPDSVEISPELLFHLAFGDEDFIEGIRARYETGIAYAQQTSRMRQALLNKESETASDLFDMTEVAEKSTSNRDVRVIQMEAWWATAPGMNSHNLIEIRICGGWAAVLLSDDYEEDEDEAMPRLLGYAAEKKLYRGVARMIHRAHSDVEISNPNLAGGKGLPAWQRTVIELAFGADYDETVWGVELLNHSDKEIRDAMKNGTLAQLAFPDLDDDEGEDESELTF